MSQGGRGKQSSTARDLKVLQLLPMIVLSYTLNVSVVS